MYAKAMGAHTADADAAWADDYKTEEGKWTSWWWLRSPGGYFDNAACVDNLGYVFDFGDYVDYVNYAVRPALQPNLSSVIG